jgi:large subunit ribosomal protein L25
VLDAHTASMALSKASSSTLVTIEVEGKEYPSLVREKQRDYIKNRLLHVDFLAVSLSEKIRAEVSLHFHGVSIAVKDYNAVFVHNLEQFHVECLPADLPERIDVDIAPLVKVGDVIRVRDIVLSDKIRVLDNSDTVVCVASAPKVEEVAAVPGAEGVVAATPTTTEPELSVERGKKEEESSEKK